MKPRPKETKPTWLLIKEHDDFERTPSDPAVTEAEPNSVVTGRSMEQIARSEDHVWNSKETAKPGQAWYRQESKSPPSDATPPTAFALPRNTKLPKESQPTFLKPQLAEQAETPPSSGDWLHELKLDGYRIQALKDGRKVQLLTRTGLDWTHRMSTIGAEVAKLPIDKATLDGEVVVLSPDGTTSFANLQASSSRKAPHMPLTYFCLRPSPHQRAQSLAIFRYANARSCSQSFWPTRTHTSCT